MKMLTQRIMPAQRLLILICLTRLTLHQTSLIRIMILTVMGTWDLLIRTRIINLLVTDLTNLVHVSIRRFHQKELERLRSHGTPLELESLPPTREEIDLLAQCNIKPEQIADTNYLAQLRLYQNLRNEMHAEPEETMEEFVRNASDVTVHKLKDGRYIHACSAARGVMYISPSVWNKMVDDKWKICVYLDGQGKNFHYINNAEEFLKLVEKTMLLSRLPARRRLM